MLRHVISALGASILLFGLAGHARADKLSRADIAKQGKAATAVVRVNSATAGTAFCIHPSGYFVTANNVFGRPDLVVSLVLDSGLPTQRAFPGRMIRNDPQSGLALVRAEGAKDFPTLPIGKTEALGELAELVYLGYPTRIPFKADQTGFPSVEVHTGSITAFDRKDGELGTFRVRGPAQAGLLGCPLLDENAAVVGVAWMIGQNVIVAIPSNRVTKFLTTPDVRYTLPRVTRANQHEPADFQASLVSFLPAPKPLSVDLVLRAGIEPERRRPMQLKDGVFQIQEPPVTHSGAHLLELIAEYRTGTLTGLVEDRDLQVGKEKIKLSACSRIQYLPRPLVRLANGKVLAGAAHGLDKVSLLLDDQKLGVDLSPATTIEVLKPGPASIIDCSFVVRADNNELGRVTTPVPIKGARLIDPAEPLLVPIQPPTMAGDTLVKNLPDIAANICLGGGGRYLVLHLPKLKKLAIFDVNEAAITRYIPITEERIVFAAGLHKVLIGTGKGTVERWSLHTGEKELTRTLPAPSNKVENLNLGWASNGPVLIGNVFYDLATLKPLPIRTPHGTPPPYSPVSGDGTVFGAWRTDISPGSSTTFVLQDDELKRYEEGPQGYVVPGADGKQVYTAHAVRSYKLGNVSNAPPKKGFFLPSAQAGFFLGITPASPADTGRLSLYIQGNPTPIWTDGAKPFGHRISFSGRENYGPWKRIFHIPRADLIILFRDDQLELRRFSLDKILEDAQQDYLLVASQPRVTGKRGSAYSYPLIVKSRKGGVQFQLGFGPKGMEVSKNGVVHWPVPADFADATADVILNIRDASGQEIFHTFTIHLLDD